MAGEDRDIIRRYIGELLGELDDHQPFADSESLITTGRLDSLVVVKLILFLETEFAVDFTRVEFDPDRFDSVDEIVAVVEESQNRAS
jgi:acyl carrier protein